jgi:signal transduction histidine kinase
VSPTPALTAGLSVALSAAVVLGAWIAGTSAIPRLVAGWRVMVPSTAFSFVCAGAALALLAGPRTPARRLLAGALTAASTVLPLATLAEYTLDVRWDVESWLGVVVDDVGANPFAGRMSGVTSASFLLLAGALAGANRRDEIGDRLTRLCGGAALAMSWIAVLAVSFDTSRLVDAPRFPGMAVMTILLLAIAAYGALLASPAVIATLAGADVDLPTLRWLVIGVFAAPLALGQLRLVIERVIDRDVAAAITAVIFAGGLAAAGWAVAGRRLERHRQRADALTELERRVAERTAELATANAHLRDSQERLRDVDRRKDEFLATLGHELRHPLTPIRTAVELLKRGDAPQDVHAVAHDVIERQIGHMVRLIDDLLDIARIAEGKIDMRRLPVDVRAVVGEALDLTRVAMAQREHDLACDVGALPLMVLGDHTRLVQVVTNLLQNACKYTPPGGRIAVTAREDATHVEVAVRDSGVGIPPEFLPYVFDKFSQLTDSKRQSEGGLGLGLALVHGFVTLSGGTVEARSAGTGQGSEFIVRLPRIEAGHRPPG